MMEEDEFSANARQGKQDRLGELIVAKSETTPAPIIHGNPIPAVVASAGRAAQFAWEEFIYGKIRNPNTRDAYERVIRRFLKHREERGKELHNVTPADVGRYLDGLDFAVATKKLQLSALRHFFDTLVSRHVIVLNPASSVRAERLQVMEGKTPEITVKQARKLMASIDATNVVGLRDRAIIGILFYTAARVGAVAGLRQREFYDLGDQHCLRFTEKGGKSREIPVRHDLKGMLTDYQLASDLQTATPQSPLFKTAIRRTKQLTVNGMTPNDMHRMVKRRIKQAGLPWKLSPHSFRVATITDLLSQGVPLEDVQNLAGHADPRTTRLYDRRGRKVTRNIVERISI